MLINTINRALKYSIIVHLVVFVFVMIGVIINQNKYGQKFIEYGVYFNFLFLQYFPITVTVVFLYLFLKHRIKKHDY
jgi:hypothetical protein